MLDDNQRAIAFYAGLGAIALPDRTNHRLEGDALAALAWRG